MKGLDKLPDSYFDRFANKKVNIKPFDPETRKKADKYIVNLRNLFEDDTEVILRGSTLFEIAGKGEIEYGIYPDNNKWQKVLDVLTTRYGEPQNTDENYARFNDMAEEIEIEIIVMKGMGAEIDKKLTKYLLDHPELLKEYEQIKYDNCESKKDYMIAKDKFFRRVVEMIPEE